MVNRVLKALSHPRDLLVYFITRFKLGCSLSDEKYLKLIFRIMFGRSLNLEDPVTFNEKLQWLKLYDRNPLYPQMVDKITAKEYVASIIGEEYIIPTLAVYQSLDELDLDELPNQLVLKTNHSGGNTGVVLCRDKATFDLDAAKKKLNASLHSDMFSRTREWPYTQIKPTVFAEKYISEGCESAPDDYKVHNFNGDPKMILVCRDRFKDSGLTSDFYSDNWEHLEIERPLHPNSSEGVARPAALEEMLKLSRSLSKKIPFVRTDFYVVNNKVFFGELTFYPASGFQGFVPEYWDKKLGDWIQLPGMNASY